MGNLELNTKAKSAEEPAMLAKENGIELTEGEAEEFFEMSDRSRELSDDKLDNVSGGRGGKKIPKCQQCGGKLEFRTSTFPRKINYYACQRCQRFCCPKDGYSLRGDNCRYCGAVAVFYL